MFFRKDAELHAEVKLLASRVAFLSHDVNKLKEQLSIQTLRIDALMKLYPYGSNADGTPRKKPGRKVKVKE